jgi:hypothetical protein
MLRRLLVLLRELGRKRGCMIRRVMIVISERILLSIYSLMGGILRRLVDIIIKYFYFQNAVYVGKG